MNVFAIGGVASVYNTYGKIRRRAPTLTIMPRRKQCYKILLKSKIVFFLVLGHLNNLTSLRFLNILI